MDQHNKNRPSVFWHTYNLIRYNLIQRGSNGFMLSSLSTSLDIGLEKPDVTKFLIDQGLK
jgi:hypothetical protein